MQFQLNQKATNVLRETPEKIKKGRMFCNVEDFVAGESNCSAPSGHGTKYFVQEYKYVEHMRDEHHLVVSVNTPDLKPVTASTSQAKSKSTKTAMPTKAVVEPIVDEDEEDDEYVDQEKIDMQVELQALRDQVFSLTTAMNAMKLLQNIAKKPTKKNVVASVPVDTHEYEVDDCSDPEPVQTPVIKKVARGRPKKVTA